VGTPIGAAPPPVQTPPPTRPTVGTPVGTTTRPVVGTPRPSVGTPVSSQSSSAPGAAAPRPQVASPARPATSVAKPAAPAKPPESKAEMSRRNFIKALAVLGGVVAVGQFAALGPFLEGSVSGSEGGTQILQDSTTGETLNTKSAKLSPENSWTTFVYPRTGNPNIDNDTFRQGVIIHLPKGWTAGQYGAQDPISGDTFVGLSRVCVHLWCLWSYVPTDFRGICPCHGSQYIPGAKAGTSDADQPGLAVAGPASLQTPPNNQLPVITLKIASDGTISATGIVGQIGCGQKC
jgi:Rieske Fe-S protein